MSLVGSSMLKGVWSVLGILVSFFGNIWEEIADFFWKKKPIWTFSLYIC